MVGNRGQPRCDLKNQTKYENNQQKVWCFIKETFVFADEIGNRKSGAQLRLRIRVPAVHTTRIAGGSFFYSMENQKSLSVVDHENRPRISTNFNGGRLEASFEVNRERYDPLPQVAY